MFTLFLVQEGKWNPLASLHEKHTQIKISYDIMFATQIKISDDIMFATEIKIIDNIMFATQIKISDDMFEGRPRPNSKGRRAIGRRRRRRRRR